MILASSVNVLFYSTARIIHDSREPVASRTEKKLKGNSRKQFCCFSAQSSTIESGGDLHFNSLAHSVGK